MATVGTQLPPGPAADAQGRTVIDPTENVKDLVDASERRSDDLRVQDKDHDREIRQLEREHAKELRHNEAARIDAILVNVRDTALATATAAETRATTLANQVTTSADALRAQVTDTAQASTDTLDRRFDPIQKSIEEIRRFQFETQGGKQQVVETHAKTGNLGLWIGIGVAGMIGSSSFLLGAAGIAVTLITRK